MTKRPFSCIYLAPESVNETRIELTYQVREGGSLERLENELGALMTSVAVIGSHGGFSGDRHHPDDSNVVLRKGETDRAELTWSFLHQNVGAGLAFALENLAHSMQFRDSHIDGVTIRTALANRSHALVPADIKGYRPVPFEYRYEVLSPSVVVDVEFLDRQDPQRIEVFRGVFDAWYSVAAAGGFADDEFLPSAEVAIFIENELQVTSVGMQVVYEGAQVGGSGFNVLTNTLIHFHSSIAPLERVEIT